MATAFPSPYDIFNTISCGRGFVVVVVEVVVGVVVVDEEVVDVEEDEVVVGVVVVVVEEEVVVVVLTQSSRPCSATRLAASVRLVFSPESTEEGRPATTS